MHRANWQLGTWFQSPVSGFATLQSNTGYIAKRYNGNMFRRALFPVLLSVPALVLGQGDPSVNAKIIAEGKGHNHTLDHLRYLTKEIGARLTSSPALKRADDWTSSQFRAFGLKNVHEEQWGEFPVGFERGEPQVARMIAPYGTDFVFTTPAWTPGTNGPMRGPAIYEPTTLDDFNKVKDQLKGAWMVMRNPMVRRRPGGADTPPPTPLETAISDADCLGKVYPSRNELVVTGGNYRITWDKLPTKRSVTIRKSDWNVISANLDKGTPVQLEFNLGNHFIKGPVPVYNVIADIPGTEKPDEYVIVNGHLDSWNGPGSEGAIDNGTGSCVAMEAARILSRVGAKPKRTIRFILWSGEEEGLLGSQAYIKAHPELLPKISAVFVDDGGTNYEGGMDCIESMKPMLQQAQESMNGAFPDMPFEIAVKEHIPIGVGSDHDSFNEVGVPGFFWHMVGTHDYNYVHHTQHDVFEQAIPKYLVQKSTNSAVMAYNVACADTLLPRDPNAAAGRMRRRGATAADRVRGGGAPVARSGGGGQ